MGPTALRHCIRDAVAFLVVLMICSLKLSLLSKVTPRNLADLDSPIMLLPTVIQTVRNKIKYNNLTGIKWIMRRQGNKLCRNGS